VWAVAGDDDFIVFVHDIPMFVAQFGAVRKLMDELEEEMDDISKEQVRTKPLLHNFDHFDVGICVFL
jgi:hypothetical protein